MRSKADCIKALLLNSLALLTHFSMHVFMLCLVPAHTIQKWFTADLPLWEENRTSGNTSQTAIPSSLQIATFIPEAVIIAVQGLHVTHSKTYNSFCLSWLTGLWNLLSSWKTQIQFPHTHTLHSSPCVSWASRDTHWYVHMFLQALVKKTWRYCASPKTVARQCRLLAIGRHRCSLITGTGWYAQYFGMACGV